MSEILKNKNFVKLWLSQMLSQFTINVMNFYVIVRIYAITRSNIAVSLVWIASALPALVFGPFSGAIVDSFSKRKMLIWTNVLQAVSVAIAMFISPRQAYPLYIITFLYWLFDQVYLPSQQASIPDLVPKKMLPSANGLFLITQQACVMFGFGFGGLLLATLGNTLTIALCSVCLLIAAGSVYYLPKDKPARTISEQSFLRYWKDFLLGYNYIKNHHMIMIPLVLIVISQIYNAIVSTILPSYAHDVLHVNLNNAGLALIVPGGIGALIVTYLLPRILAGRRKKDVLQTGLLIGGLSLLGMGALYILPFAYRALVSLVFAAGLGASVGLILVPAQTLVQQNTPVWFRGRVYAQMGVLLIIATTLPLFVSATIADLVGSGTLLALMGLLMLGGYYLAYRKGDYVISNGFGI
jgi:MFS family permease